MKKTDAEREILSALRSRDTRALEMIAESYGPLMRRVAFNLGLSRDDTEECLNDALLETWNTVPPAVPRSVRSYVCVIMRRVAIDKIRYNSAEKRRDTVYIEVLEELCDVASFENDVVDGMVIPQVLEKFLSELDADNREIFIRRFVEFESTASIASDMGLRAGAVEARLTRMRVKLKKMLARWGLYT